MSETTLTQEQIEAIDRLDLALCQFLNNADDAYDPRVWVESIKRDFKDLSDAYNACHKTKAMNWDRIPEELWAPLSDESAK